MKKLLLVLLLAALPAYAQDVPAPVAIPQPDGSILVVLSPAMVAFCGENGGCRIVTGDALIKWLEEAKKTCGPSI